MSEKKDFIFIEELEKTVYAIFKEIATTKDVLGRMDFKIPYTKIGFNTPKESGAVLSIKSTKNKFLKWVRWEPGDVDFVEAPLKEILEEEGECSVSNRNVEMALLHLLEEVAIIIKKLLLQKKKGEERSYELEELKKALLIIKKI